MVTMIPRLLLLVALCRCLSALAMALTKQVVPVLIKGLNQKLPKQAGVTGALDSLFNMYVQKGGGDGFEVYPRPGLQTPIPAAADNGSITTGMRLGLLGGSLALLTGTACYRKALDEWHQVDANTPVMSVQTTPIVVNSTFANSSDTEYANGYTVQAMIDPNGAGLTVIVNDPNGTPTFTPFSISTNSPTDVRIVVAGQYVVVLWGQLQAGANTIAALRFNSLAPTAGFAGPVNVTTTANIGLHYDAQATPAGKIAVLWNDSGTTNLTQTLLDPATLTTSGTTAYAGLGTNFVSKGYLTNNFSSNVLFVAHASTAAGVRVTQFDSATLALNTTTTFDAGATSAFILGITGTRVGSAIAVYYMISSVSHTYDTVIMKTTGGASVSVKRSLAIASRPLLANGTSYMLTKYISSGQSTYFLLDLGTSNAVGMAMMDTAAYDGSLNGLQVLPNLAVGPTANTWITSGLHNVAVISNGGAPASYIGASQIVFTYQDATVGRPVELNGGMHIPGSAPYLYDGAVIVENGFPIAPEQGDAPVFGAGGVLTANQAYTYRWTYAWTDAAGNLQRSAPSAPQTVTAAALGVNTKITWSIPTLRLTRKTNAVIETWRTVGNGDGSVYFKATPATSPLLNSTTTDRVTFVDTFTDAQIVGNEPLYTDGNVLENIAAPPCKAFVAHRGRLLVGGVDGDPTAIWFSKDVENGFGVAFSDALVSRLTSAEAVTAVGSMDSYALACTASQTWASSDDYPDDTGSPSVLRFIQVSSNIGCSGARAMARTDQGTHVWGGKIAATTGGAKGAWLLSRGLSYSYIGSAMEDDAANSGSPLDVAAIVSVPHLNQVRYLMPSNNQVMVYETIFGTWAKWTYAFPPIDAVVWQGALAYLGSADGLVRVEDTTLTGDDSNGTVVARSVTFNSFNFAGVAGFQRIYIGQFTGRMLGTVGVGASSRIVASQAMDGVSIPDKIKDVAPDAGVLGLEVDPGNAGKCSTYAITLSNSSSNSVNDPRSAWTLVAATMLVGIKPGLSRLPPADRMA